MTGSTPDPDPAPEHCCWFSPLFWAAGIMPSLQNVWQWRMLLATRPGTGFELLERRPYVRKYKLKTQPTLDSTKYIQKVESALVNLRHSTHCTIHTNDRFMFFTFVRMHTSPPPLMTSNSWERAFLPLALPQFVISDQWHSSYKPEAVCLSVTYKIQCRVTFPVWKPAEIKGPKIGGTKFLR